MGTSDSKNCKFNPTDEEYNLIYDQLNRQVIKPCKELLFSAARNGRHDIVAHIMQNSHLDVTADNDQALYEAFANHHFGVVVMLLLDPKSDPNRIFSLCCETSNEYLVELMIADPRIDIGRNQQEALKIAVAKNSVGVVKKLMKQSKSTPPIEILELAAEFGYLECFKLLLTRLGIMNNKLSGLNGCLKKAATNGRLEIVRLILRTESSIPRDESLLSSIIYYNFHVTDDAKQSEILVECFKYWSFIPDDQTHHLVTVAMRGDSKILDVLLSEHRIKLEIPSKNDKFSILSEIIECDYNECVQLVLLNAKRRRLPAVYWEYAITSAVKKMRYEFVASMLNTKYNGFNPSFDHNKIIILSMQRDDVKMVETIVNCDVIDLSQHQSYILRYAISHKKLLAAKIIVSDVRVDPSIWNNSLLMTAVRQGDNDMVKFLLKDHRVKPSTEILTAAVEMENITIIKSLTEFPRLLVDLKTLKLAAKSKNSEIFDLMLKLPSSDFKQASIFCTAQGFHNFADQINSIIM